MNKKWLYGGGAAVVLIIGYVIVSKHAAASQASADSQGNAVVSGASDASVATSSVPTTIPVDSSYDTPSVADNSGSTATGGGFDISGLLSGLLSNQATSSAANTAANQSTANNAILSSIIGALGGGTATLSTSASGTTVSASAPVAPLTVAQQQAQQNQTFLTGEYQNLLGRAPDAAGLAFFTNAINTGQSYSQIDADFKSSAEYQQKTASK